MQELGKPDKALAFCKRAAELEPSAADPYAKSLVFLASAKEVDTDAIQWAAGNLMRHEWVADKDAHHARAQKALAEAVARLRAGGRSDDADRVQASLDRDKQRDLVVDAIWADQADLDLEITEPTGALLLAAAAANYWRRPVARRPAHGRPRRKIPRVLHGLRRVFRVVRSPGQEDLGPAAGR